jgi:hypothetical protein
MHSTLNPKPNDDPHDVVVVPPDAVRVAPVDDELSNLLHQAARRRSDTQIHTASGATAATSVPPVDATFRPSAVNDVLASGNGPSIGRRVGRAFAALLLAACIGAAAVGWQAFGYAGKKMIVKWTPQFVLTSLSMDRWGLAAPSATPDTEADAVDAAPPQPAPEGVAANAAAPSADSAQLLQSMARNLASVSQEVEQLKASIEQLKASQQQMSRDVVKSSELKASEQSARARVAALPPRPAIPRPHKPIPSYPPVQAYPPAQAAAAPPLPQAATPYVPQAYVPRQPEPLPLSPAAAPPQPEPGFESVPRPPMPLR